MSEAVNVKVANIDNRTFGDIPEGCRTCIYWESPDQFRKASPKEAEKIKAEWFNEVAKVFSPCGKILYVDDEPAAYCQFAPPEHVPGIAQYEGLANYLDGAAVFISCLVVRDRYQGKGLGPRLLKEVVEDLRSRGYKAVETFARDDSVSNCSGPTRLYVKQGFTVVASKTWPEGTFPLVRLDLGD